MRRLNVLVVAAVVAAAGSGAGCHRSESGTASGPVAPMLPDRAAKKKSSGATPGQEAVARVLDEDRQSLKAGFDTLQADAQPSAFAAMIGGLVERGEAVDVAGCPSEFRSARGKYLKAWAALKTALGKYPDAYDDVDFVEGLRDAFNKGRTKSRKLGGGVVDAVKKVLDAHAEVSAAAENAGLEVDAAK